jgi:hypothetical protein
LCFHRYFTRRFTDRVHCRHFKLSFQIISLFVIVWEVPDFFLMSIAMFRNCGYNSSVVDELGHLHLFIVCSNSYQMNSLLSLSFCFFL